MLTKWTNIAKGKLKDLILTQRRAQNSVHFSDTTLRDGEQMPGAALTIDGKVAIAKGLAELGIDSLDDEQLKRFMAMVVEAPKAAWEDTDKLLRETAENIRTGT
jgi:hypothetical protein